MRMSEYKEFQRFDELIKSDLSAQELDYLGRYSKGLYFVGEFTRLFKNKRDQVGQLGYSLGLDNYVDWVGRRPYYEISRELRLKCWKEGYRKHGLDWKGVTGECLRSLVNVYLEKITNDNEPVVFFIPSNIRSHPRKGVTSWELDWYLKTENKDRLRDTYFVFGLYERAISHIDFSFHKPSLAYAL